MSNFITKGKYILFKKQIKVVLFGALGNLIFFFIFTLVKRTLSLLLFLVPMMAFSQAVVQQSKTPSSGATAGNQYFQWYGGAYTGYLIIPTWTNATANRQTPLNGQFGFQLSDSTGRVYYNGSWLPMGGGGSASSIFFKSPPFTGDGTSGNPIGINFNSLFPSQTGNAGKFLTTNGDTVLWGNPGTLTSITPGFGFTNHTPITSTGTLTIDTAASVVGKLPNGDVYINGKLYPVKGFVSDSASIVTSNSTVTALTLNQATSPYLALQVNGGANFNGQAEFQQYVQYDQTVDYEQNLDIQSIGFAPNLKGIQWWVNGSNHFGLQYSSSDSSLHYSKNNNIQPGNRVALFSDITGFGSGTVTSVSAGTGMSFSTITTTGAVNADTTVLRTVANSRSLAQTQTALNLKANLASPTFTGTPAVPTAAPGTNTTQAASTAFVAAAVTAGGVSGANPTASIGVTTVNGAATTYMRSDAAPKADTSALQTVLNFFPKGDTRYQRSIFPWEPTTPSYNTVPPLSGDSVRIAIDKAYNNSVGTRFFYPSQQFYKYRYTQSANNYYAARTASSTPLHVMMVGHSFFAYSPLAILDAYGQKGGLNSIGFVGPYANIFGSGMTTYAYTGTLNTTYTLTRNDNTSAATWGIAGQRMDMTGASSLTVKPNDRYSFDRVRIFYLKTVGGGSFSYSIDGGGAVTISTAHASGPDSLGVVTINSGLNTQASHSVAVTWVSGSVRFYGYEFDNQAESGYVVDIIQSGGSRANQWDKLGFLAQYTALTTPAQMVVLLGVNDATSSVTPSAFKTAIQGIITGAGLPALSSTILMGWWPKQTSAGSGVEDLTVDALQAQYAAQELSLVSDATYSASYYDLRAKLPSFAQMVAANMWSDDEHPNINNAPDIWFQLVDNIVPNSTNPISAGTFDVFNRNSMFFAPNRTSGVAASNQNGAGGLVATRNGLFFSTLNGTLLPEIQYNSNTILSFASDSSTNANIMTAYPLTGQVVVLASQRLNTRATNAWKLSNGTNHEFTVTTNNTGVIFATNFLTFGTGSANALSSGTFNFSGYYPSINQSGTAGARGIYESALWTAAGSGVNELLHLGNNTAANNGGTDTAKFVVKRNGNVGHYSSGGLGTQVMWEIVPSSFTSYNWNYPTTAGTAGQVLTSQAGGATAMTWSPLMSKPHTIFTPTTGGTVSLTNNQYNIINPAGALVALTVNLPSTPTNNDCVFIKFTQSITTVTYANGTVVDGIASPVGGGLVVLTYDSGTTSWY